MAVCRSYLNIYHVCTNRQGQFWHLDFLPLFGQQHAFPLILQHSAGLAFHPHLDGNSMNSICAVVLYFYQRRNRLATAKATEGSAQQGDIIGGSCRGDGHMPLIDEVFISSRHIDEAHAIIIIFTGFSQIGTGVIKRQHQLFADQVGEGFFEQEDGPRDVRRSH